MSYPTLVYRVPGAHFGPEGKTYSYLAVNDEHQMRDALASGWHATLSEALQPAEKEPTLAELAAALGIKVDRRWSESRLREEIEKASERPMTIESDK